MQSIDVHDLPEPIARAIQSMVHSIRTSRGGTTASADSALESDNGPTIGDALAPLLDDVGDSHLSSEPVALKGQEAEIENSIVEKFRRQGLKL